MLTFDIEPARRLTQAPQHGSYRSPPEAIDIRMPPDANPYRTFNANLVSLENEELLRVVPRTLPHMASAVATETIRKDEFDIPLAEVGRRIADGHIEANAVRQYLIAMLSLIRGDSKLYLIQSLRHHLVRIAVGLRPRDIRASTLLMVADAGCVKANGPRLHDFTLSVLANCDAEFREWFFARRPAYRALGFDENERAILQRQAPRDLATFVDRSASPNTHESLSSYFRQARPGGPIAFEDEM